MTVSNATELPELFSVIHETAYGLDPNTIGNDLNWAHIRDVNDHVQRMGRKRLREEK